jgi:cytochrome c553
MAENDDGHPRELIHFTRLQRLAIATGIVIGSLLVGLTAFIWSGYYNVAASRQHWDITTWLLEIIRDQSIGYRASSIIVPPLDDENLMRLGAEHYRSGCAVCHGVPGEKNTPLFAGMLPHPPDLTYASQGYSSAELFWIVTHGLKFTGMPPWPAEAREDEVWAMVAFLERLYRDGPDAYPRLVASLPDPATTIDAELTGVTATALENCVRCHGAKDRPPASDLVPSLSGQNAAYLTRAIREYKEELRPSGFMLPVAHEMTDEETRALVAYYAGLDPVTRNGDPDEATLEHGARIATAGLPETGVPACLSCHSGGASPLFPVLAGQSARYLEGQLQIWREGLRDRTGYGAIMAEIARRLTGAEAHDVAAWFAAQAPGKLPAAGAAP